MFLWTNDGLNLAIAQWIYIRNERILVINIWNISNYNISIDARNINIIISSSSISRT